MVTKSEFVNVNIDIQVAAITAAGFGRGMFVYNETAGNEPAGFGGNRTKLYTSADEVLDDFTTSDPAYKAAAAYFLPNTAPQELVISFKLDTDADYTTALNAIIAESLGTDSFGIAIDSATEADILEVSTWAALNNKQFFAKTADAGVPNQAITDDVASDLLTANSDQTSIYYWDGAATEYMEVEVMGAFLARSPGQFDVAFYQTKGLYTNSLTSSEKTVLASKRVNYLTLEGGATFIAHGFASRINFFPDMYRNRLYMQSRITESVLNLLVVNTILPGDDIGGAMVYQSIAEILQQMTNERIIQQGWVVSVPKFADRPSADRAARILNGVTFKADLVGAINSVTINGTLVA